MKTNKLSLTMGDGITQTHFTTSLEKDVYGTSYSTQTQDTHFLSSATDMPQSGPMDSSEQLFSLDDSFSLEFRMLNIWGHHHL